MLALRSAKTNLHMRHAIKQRNCKDCGDKSLKRRCYSCVDIARRKALAKYEKANPK